VREIDELSHLRIVEFEELLVAFAFSIRQFVNLKIRNLND